MSSEILSFQKISNWPDKSEKNELNLLVYSKNGPFQTSGPLKTTSKIICDTFLTVPKNY